MKAKNIEDHKEMKGHFEREFGKLQKKIDNIREDWKRLKEEL